MKPCPWPSASTELTQQQQEETGKEGVGNALAFKSTGCAEIAGMACMFGQIRGLVLDWNHTTWLKWFLENCRDVRFFSFVSRFVSFCCPEVLMLAVGVALSGAVLWIL